MHHVRSAAHLRSMFAVVALLVVSSFVAGCGGSGQDRPAVVSVFPADGQVLPGWLGCIRITYDEPVEVLSERAARVAVDALGEDGGVPVLIVEDPGDPNSILVVPDFGGHFFPGEEHHVVIQQGAVINAEDHYALEEFDAFFTVGAAPNLFLTTTTGNVYEVDPDTGAQVFVTAPPAGFSAHAPVGADDRVFVWLDGAGDDQVGTFVPGTATIATSVPLAGETGLRQGSHLVLDSSGRTLYATARDGSK